MPRLLVGDEEYDADVNRIRFGEAVAIEEATGQTFGEWSTALSRGSMIAVQAFVWIIKRRSDPTCRINDIADLELTSVKLIEDPAPKAKPVHRGRVTKAAPASDPTPLA